MKLPKLTICVTVILLFGLGLRIIYALVSDHIFYADELFQSLEQGFRAVNGFGIIPWEYHDGMRSWVVPGILACILSILKIAQIADPHIYIPAVKIFFSLLSLCIPFSLYKISQKTFQDTPLSLVVLGIASIWYECIYFASRPLSEVIATYLLLSGFSLLLSSNEKISIGISGFLMGIGGYIRPQYIIVIPFLFLLWKQVSKYISRQNIYIMLVGIIFAFVLGGFIDLVTFGTWFQSLWLNLFINLKMLLIPSIYQNLGYDNPLFYYISALVITFGGLSLLSLALPKKYYQLWLIILSIIVPHMLLGNKQYRFIFLTIPLLLLVSVAGLWEFLKSKGVLCIKRIIVVLCLFSLISFLGIRYQLPKESQIYPQPLLFISPQLTLYQSLYSTSDVCGIFDDTQLWMLTGGYYYLGKNVPLYAVNYRPSNPLFANYVISYKHDMNIEDYQRITTLGNVSLYKRPGPCTIDHTYAYTRLVEETVPK